MAHPAEAGQRGTMPDVEHARLRSLALHGLGRDESDFDAVDLEMATRLLAHVTGSSAAAVHLVDADVQRRIAATGAPLEERPRSASLCAVTMWQAGPRAVFETPVAADDPRLSAVPTDGVGFYAAAPLLGREGLPLGTVCVWDGPERGPRALTPQQCEAVADLAEFVARLLSARRQNRLLSHDSLHDPLTLLPNRRLLLDRLDHALARTQRTEVATLVAMVDLDGFKAVNDTHGHAAGDGALVAVAERLRSVVRPEDTVARWGGDEFVVVAECLPGTAYEAVTDRLLHALDVPLETAAGLPLSLSLTVGVALGQWCDTADVLLERADAAMYAQRRARRAVRVPHQPRAD